MQSSKRDTMEDSHILISEIYHKANIIKTWYQQNVSTYSRIYSQVIFNKGAID